MSNAAAFRRAPVGARAPNGASLVTHSRFLCLRDLRQHAGLLVVVMVREPSGSAPSLNWSTSWFAKKTVIGRVGVELRKNRADAQRLRKFCESRRALWEA